VIGTVTGTVIGMVAGLLPFPTSAGPGGLVGSRGSPRSAPPRPRRLAGVDAQEVPQRAVMHGDRLSDLEEPDQLEPIQTPGYATRRSGSWAAGTAARKDSCRSAQAWARVGSSTQATSKHISAEGRPGDRRAGSRPTGGASTPPVTCPNRSTGAFETRVTTALFILKNRLRRQPVLPTEAPSSDRQPSPRAGSRRSRTSIAGRTRDWARPDPHSGVVTVGHPLPCPWVRLSPGSVGWRGDLPGSRRASC
jgi:hypothetical protein